MWKNDSEISSSRLADGAFCRMIQTPPQTRRDQQILNQNKLLANHRMTGNGDDPDLQHGELWSEMHMDNSRDKFRTEYQMIVYSPFLYKAWSSVLHREKTNKKKFSLFYIDRAIASSWSVVAVSSKFAPK